MLRPWSLVTAMVRVLRKAGRIVEPLQDYHKDEVRVLGAVGLPRGYRVDLVSTESHLFRAFDRYAAWSARTFGLATAVSRTWSCNSHYLRHGAVSHRRR